MMDRRKTYVLVRAKHGGRRGQRWLALSCKDPATAVHRHIPAGVLQQGARSRRASRSFQPAPGESMKHGRGGGQAPWEGQQYPPQYGDSYPQGEPLQQPQYDPRLHAQRINGGQPKQQYEPGWQQYPPQAPAWQVTPPRAPAPRRKRHTVRNVFAGFGGLVVVIIVIAVAANGGGHTVQTTGSGTTPTTDSGTDSTTGGTGSTTQKAVIGSAITLAGNGSGEQMAVTVTKVISSAQPGDQFTSAPAGDRLYAVQFRLRDTGSAAYSDSPSNGAAVVDSSGQSYQASITDTVAGCQAFSTPENIAPGDSGLGCIVFEVPKSAKIGEVQFTLDSGMGPQTGQWDVAG